MKIKRSTKCSLKFMTASKRSELEEVLSEYSKTVNFFIDHFWATPIAKDKLFKEVVNLPQTWLTARLRKVAAREALDMISAVTERWKDEPDKITKPLHRGTRMCVSSTIATLKQPKHANEFDLWLELRSIGKQIAIDIPVRLHKHYHLLASQGKRLNAYIITKDYVQFVFEVNTGPKRTGNKRIGIDSGMHVLAATSDGNKYGTDIYDTIKRIKRCKHGSKGQNRARRAAKQRMDEIAKEVIKKENPDLVVVEQLKNVHKKLKLKRRLSRNIRRFVNTWTYRYWLRRLQFAAETNRVSFRSVSPWNTSKICSCCGHVDDKNRPDRDTFLCQSCGHTDDADVNAAKNVLGRFETGTYGSCCKVGDKKKIA